MKTIQERLDDWKRGKGEAIGPPVVVIQAKGDTEIRRQTELQQRRGYVLEKVEAQGRKRAVLTFRLPA